MKTYLCKWPDHEILYHEADPGLCKIVRIKKSFVLGLKVEVPKQPAAGQPGLSTQAPGGAAASSTAQEPEPWVTKQDLCRAGLVNNDADERRFNDYVKMKLLDINVWYEECTERLPKKITKAFYPKTYEALKEANSAEQEVAEGDVFEEEGECMLEDAVTDLRKALAADLDAPNDYRQHQEAMFARAAAGDQAAALGALMDFTANPFGPEPDDSATDDDDDDQDSEDSF